MFFWKERKRTDAQPCIILPQCLVRMIVFIQHQEPIIVRIVLSAWNWRWDDPNWLQDRSKSKCVVKRNYEAKIYFEAKSNFVAKSKFAEKIYFVAKSFFAASVFLYKKKTILEPNIDIVAKNNFGTERCIGFNRKACQRSLTWPVCGGKFQLTQLAVALCFAAHYSIP